MDAGPVRTYLGVPLYRPKVAFFEFSSCEAASFSS